MESGVMSGVAFYFGRRADTVYYRACTEYIYMYQYLWVLLEDLIC